MSIRQPIVVLSGLLLATTLTAQNQRNLLVIIPDDLGIDSIGCYGMPHPAPTPVLDSLAQAGMRFTRMYANPACTPSRAALLSGRYAFRNGTTSALPPGATGITPSEVLLPQILGGAGYNTGMIGKWHLGTWGGADTPNLMGFGYFKGILDSGANPYQWPMVEQGTTTVCTNYIMTEMTNSVISWIQAQTGPWVMVFTPTLPHVPYHTPPASLHTQNLAGLSPATTPRPFFEAMVQAMDTEIGRLLTSLSPSVLANTNIVVIPDNGTDNSVAMAPVQPSHAKGSLYEFGSHVPLIVKGPAVPVPGSVCSALLSGVDLMPTLVEMCGVQMPALPPSAPLDGLSFASMLANPGLPGRPFVYSEITGTPLGQGYTVLSDSHRLIRYMRTQPQHQELYCVTADPLEQADLLTTTSATQQLAASGLMGAMDQIRRDGWAELFGAGCASGANTTTFSTQTNPEIGHNFYLSVQNLPTSALGSIVMVGLSRTSAGGVPLPVDLTVFGSQGCELAVSPDLLLSVGPNGISAPVMIPAITSLYGFEVYCQAVIADPQATANGLAWSRSLRCIIGE